MQFRKSFLPHTVSDIACFLLLFSFITITFIFELYVVLPAFHDTDGFLYKAYWVLGLFVVFNLKGNLLATMLVDTSIRTTILRPPVKPPLRKLWRYCEWCEALAPPRSWHCQICRSCILKRDHHCMFAGCCIGHHNHRYFFYVIVYLLIGSTVATIYNSLYFWWLHVEVYARISTIWKLLFPLFIFIFDVSWSNMHLFIYELCVIGMLYSILLLCYHLPVILRGCVVHEVSRAMPDKYNEGWRRNLRMVLGERMFLTWLSPFVRSPLPHDGAHWEPQLPQTSKNR